MKQRKKDLAGIGKKLRGRRTCVILLTKPGKTSKYIQEELSNEKSFGITLGTDMHFLSGSMRIFRLHQCPRKYL